MNRKERDFERDDEFMRTLAHELSDMPDSLVMDGEDANQLLRTGASLLVSVTAEAGRRRLARAREKLAVVKDVQPSDAPAVSANDARARLRELSNSNVFTLAARELSDISDEDVLRLYQQVRDLMSDTKDQS